MRRGRPLRSARAGLAAVEFALVAPVLLTFFLGTIDLSKALITRRRLEFAARATTEIASTTAAQSLAQNILTNTGAWQATTAAFALFPAWATKSLAPVFTVTLSSVSFTATPSNRTQGCSYSAAVTWSLANDLGQPQLRACGALAAAPDTAPPSYTTLPAGNFGGRPRCWSLTSPTPSGRRSSASSSATSR